DSFLLLLCSVASLGGFLFGFDTAVISGTIAMVVAQFHLSPFQEGFFASAALMGCVIGTVASGTLSDRIGRKPVLLLSAALFVASAAACAVPNAFETLVVARIASGIAVGVASVVAPMYISEFAPASSRGRFVALYQLSIVIGVLVAYYSNWLLVRNAAQAAPSFVGWFGPRIMQAEPWRAMFGAAIFPAFAFGALLLAVPESPRWLWRKGKREQAMAIAGRLANGGEILGSGLAEESPDSGSWRDLFRPGLRTALFVAVMLSVFGQLSGVSIVVYYGPKILASAGFAKEAALLGQVGFGLINLVATLVAMTIIDRFGRRPLLIFGTAAVALTLFATGAVFDSAGSGTPSATAALWIGILICVYMAAVAISICSVIWVITAEIFPTSVRGRGTSLATLANWTTNTLSALFFPVVVNAVGMAVGCYVIGAICVVATWFYWKRVPETKGKTLEQIEQLWVRK
ncbi:MAG: sugar transporter, partial [Verrucomicrobia bacterium]|nr:sugar transporter [Verrucomicrobiota bacterium]